MSDEEKQPTKPSTWEIAQLAATLWKGEGDFEPLALTWKAQQLWRAAELSHEAQRQIEWFRQAEIGRELKNKDWNEMWGQKLDEFSGPQAEISRFLRACRYPVSKVLTVLFPTKPEELKAMEQQTGKEVENWREGLFLALLRFAKSENFQPPEEYLADSHFPKTDIDELARFVLQRRTINGIGVLWLRQVRIAQKSKEARDRQNLSASEKTQGAPPKSNDAAPKPKNAS